jgi:hypothetical protein
MKISQSKATFAIILAGILLTARPLSAQLEQGSITGTVQDSSGAVVPGAEINLVDTSTKVRHVARTNSSGSYVIPYLTPARYQLTVTKPGFATEVVDGIEITVGLTATVNATLSPGSEAQRVTVAASSVELEQQSSTLGSTISGKQMVELPVLGRNPFTLVLMAPGVVQGNNAGNPVTATVNGGRTSSMDVLLDGAEARNSIGNGAAYTPPLEAVGEVKIITNNFSAEYGRSGGGVLTATTRSGTNALHGSAYEFFENDKLNANGWLANRNGLPRTEFRHNEFGFSLGGPIYIPHLYHGRDKTFFFSNVEDIVQRTPDSINGTVPTAAERNGDFSQTRNAAGQLLQIYDPLTTVPNPQQTGQYIRSVFPGNMIPASRINPISAKIATYYPLPNRTVLGANFAQNETVQGTDPRMLFRVDHQIGEKHHLFVTHGRENKTTLTPGVTIAFPAEGSNAAATMLSNSHSTSLSDSVVFSPTLVGEFRATLVRNVIPGTPASLGFNSTSLGLPASLQAQSSALLFPYINTTDLSPLGVGNNTYSNNTQQNEGALAHVTWSRGTHIIKAGFDLSIGLLNAFKDQYPSGSYNFSRAFTQGPNPATATVTGGDGFATMLLGAPTGGSFSFDPSLAVVQKSTAVYFQDDWKIRRNLTVNLGVRYDYASPWEERYSRLAYFDTTGLDPVTHSPGVLRLLGSSATGQSQVAPNTRNIAPRLGVAWSVNPKTVIRAGGGIFYFPGNGAISASPTALGDGYYVTNSVYLGPSPGPPNTPPLGASLSNPYVSGLVTPPSLLVGSSIATRFHYTITPLSTQWNISIQRQLPLALLLELAYVGNRGEHLWMGINENAVNPKYLSLGSGLTVQTANPYYGEIATGALSSKTVALSQLLRPYPQYVDITNNGAAIGDSIYHGGIARVERAFKGGVLVHFAYTFSKIIDNVPANFASQSSLINPYNLGESRSLGDWNRTQTLSSSFVWQLPFGRGKPLLTHGIGGAIAGGWQLSGVLTLGTGIPVAITGTSNTGLPGVTGSVQRLHNPNLPSGQQTLSHWFDTTAFAQAAIYTLGSGSRNEPNLTAPGLSNLNASLARTFQIREWLRLQIRGDFFNTLNTPPFGPPNGNVTSVIFGQVTTLTTASPGRIVQLGARFSF